MRLQRYFLSFFLLVLYIFFLFFSFLYFTKENVSGSL